MKKGALISIVVIVGIFFGVPLIFWFFTKGSTDIRGAKTQDLVGVVVEIESSGTWGLSGYVCKTQEGCLSSLSAGDRVKTTGGGKGEGQVTLEYSEKWDEYNFLKMFVKPGWGSSSEGFEVEEFGGTTSASVHEVSDVEVAIVPLDDIRTGLFETVKFSD